MLYPLKFITTFTTHKSRTEKMPLCVRCFTFYCLDSSGALHYIGGGQKTIRNIITSICSIGQSLHILRNFRDLICQLMLEIGIPNVFCYFSTLFVVLLLCFTRTGLHEVKFMSMKDLMVFFILQIHTPNESRKQEEKHHTSGMTFEYIGNLLCFFLVQEDPTM